MENPLLLPPLTLAYLGDSIYEAFVRERMLDRGIVKVNDLHKATMKYVRATAQAEILEALLPSLSEQERDVVRRGRNAKGHAAPKSAEAADYAASTGFEALIGYLHLAGRTERLGEVLEAAARHVERAG
ncbi:MAG: Mini-ribonuclease 3 [Bacillota bacterium]